MMKKLDLTQKKKATRLPTEADIRQRAQEIFLARGGRPGHEIDDWEFGLVTRDRQTGFTEVETPKTRSGASRPRGAAPRCGRITAAVVEPVFACPQPGGGIHLRSDADRRF